ncbi:molybdopterin-dependent oxidoreductase [Fredinandcohnia quinoae]|uniref:Molybdopterin-dependent oxidoreductase n=1 Tax=Fredinandcohnia quinoae TaxID=2918902 RepID=A0AAW5E5G2_9BACI|nr:molybdopterin-dependent oxidoreductase [Fredinandcohnia sp. SECRCQ15]MCH1626774.1 molybdopterin-dependent oxidoreductase [Fredinandcohnia sp. SECRCQ15]
MTTYKSACPLNCWDSCGFEVEVENGKVIKIDGNKDHPITKGKICGRGRMLEARTNSHDRILHPLKKIDGVFQKISWEQALDEIAHKLTIIKEAYGTTAVFHSHDYANGGLLTKIPERFFNCYGGVTEIIGSICWGSGIEAQKWDFGNAASHAPEDIYNSKNVIIWGRNVSRTNMHLYGYLQDVKKKGTKIIVIDPIYNATAKMAHSYIPIKPGMDGFLAIGVMKEIIRLNKEDKHFIKNYTVGFSDLEELLDRVSIEFIETNTNVPRETITELAHVYSDGPTATYMGLGMQRYANGGNTIRLIDALVAISGNVGRPGGGANFGNLQVGQSFDSNALTLPSRKTNTRTFTMMQQAEGILSAIDPEIQMVMVSCGNPLTQVPDTSIVQKAFKSVQTIVVLEQFMTDTAKLADYVLPSATVFEEEDIYYSSMYHHYVNYGPKLVDPPGEVRSDVWIWTELAKRLGFGDDFNYTREEFIRMGLGELQEKDITLEKLREEHHLPLPVEHVPWHDYQFLTPSGKYEFTSTIGEEKGLDGHLKIVYPKESTFEDAVLAQNFPYSLLTIHPLRSNHSQHYHLIDSLQTVKVEISTDIAEDKGLNPNDKVRVYNERGEIIGKVQILKHSAPNIICIDEGQWHEFGGSVNQLTPNRVSDNGLGSTLYDCLVNIEKIMIEQ